MKSTLSAIQPSLPNCRAHQAPRSFNYNPIGEQTAEAY